MNQRDSARSASLLSGREPMMDEVQAKDEAVDLTLDRIFAVTNAVEDRTVPSIDLDKLIAAAFAKVDAEHRDVDNEVQRPPRQLESAREGILGSCTAGRIFERMRDFRVMLMKFVRHAWFDSSRGRTALYLCAVYSLTLVISIGYGETVLGMLGSFTAGVIAAATGSEMITKLVAKLRCQRLIRTRERLWRGAYHEPSKWSDTPIYDLTADSFIYQVKEVSDQQRREFMVAGHDVPFLHVHEAVEEPNDRDRTVHLMLGRPRLEVIETYDDEKSRLPASGTKTREPWSCS